MKIKRKFDITHVYLVSDSNGFCKLGVAKNIKSRLGFLQTGNPKRLFVVKSWEFKNRDDAYLLEGVVLGASTNSCAVGEWLEADTLVVVRLVEYIINKISNKDVLKIKYYSWCWNVFNNYNKEAIAHQKKKVKNG